MTTRRRRRSTSRPTPSPRSCALPSRTPPVRRRPAMLRSSSSKSRSSRSVRQAAGAGASGSRIRLSEWTHAFDSELRYQLPRTSIPPGATRYVDVGRWLRLADASADLSFVLSVIPEPATLRHVLPPGGWRLRLSATLQNGDATFWDAKISYGFMFSAGIAQLIDVKATVVKVASASAPAASG